MTLEELAFLTALTENTDDLDARLVYADWLDEHDRPDEAAYLRHSVELVRLCVPRVPVLQTLILKEQLPQLLVTRNRLAREWITVVHSPKFDLLYENEAQRVARAQREAERARAEAEQARLQADRAWQEAQSMRPVSIVPVERPMQPRSLRPRG